MSMRTAMRPSSRVTLYGRRPTLFIPPANDNGEAWVHRFRTALRAADREIALRELLRRAAGLGVLGVLAAFAVALLGIAS